MQANSGMLPLLIGLTMAAPPESIDDVLDALHQAATDADATTYFGLFAPEAVFIGTDATEVWTLDAFQAFASPHFTEAPAWSYTPLERQVHLGPKRRTAWFYETLKHASYGEVRGSGALVRVDGTWKISQYVLSFPIPNERARDVLRVVYDEPHLPPPFSAAQIRDTYRPGLTLVTHERSPEQQRWQRLTVVSATDDAVTLRLTPLDADHEPLGAGAEHTVQWTELRDHAAFPMHGTTWSEERLETPLGPLDTRRYVVTRGDDVTTYWFATAYPGQPVAMTVERAGAGYSRLEMIDRSSE